MCRYVINLKKCHQSSLRCLELLLTESAMSLPIQKQCNNEIDQVTEWTLMTLSAP